MKKSFSRIYNSAKRNTDGKLVKVTVGICAMDKKAKSKPMKEILGRLPESMFQVIIFGDDTILNRPVEAWPVVEVLIAFYSSKYPTDKVLEYVRLRHPFMINDLEMNDTLKDRRRVYELLQANGIHVPVHVYCERDKRDRNGELLEDTNVVEEFDEYILVNGQQINKPLVEKPVDAEDHNIYLYYPNSAGGGSKRLFRKVNDRSSEFYPNANEVRREGSFIYEEFIVTQGTDVKVYTVGPDYGHAEARKSPVVDGKVNRDKDGLEVRYPVILSPTEKEMARKIVLAFKQTVCGFDILRVHGRSFCCDVNGFSFVKNSRKYYDDASQVLIELMLNEMRPHYNAALSTRAPLTQRKKGRGKLSEQVKKFRRPSSLAKEGGATLTAANLIKQQERQRGLAAGAGGSGQNSGDERTLRSSNEDDKEDKMSDVGLEPTRDSVSGIEGKDEKYDPDVLSRRMSQSAFTDRDALSADGGSSEELRCIIAITRHADRTPKQKMKFKVSLPSYLNFFQNYSKSPTKDLKVKSKSALTRFLKITQHIMDNKEVRREDDSELYQKLRLIRDVLERWEISGINRKLQMKPTAWEDLTETEAGTGVDMSETETVYSTNSKTGLSEQIFGEKPGIAAGGNDARSARFLYNNLGMGGGVSAPNLVRSISGSSADVGKSSTDTEKSAKPKGPNATEILVILKWGGDLTPLGREQAENMGENFRHLMYPDNEGGGVLRLHATYRHDLKIKASDEGRVMKTAAAFAKGLLELEGQLTPIIASLVTIEEKNRNLLDHGGNKAVKEDLENCKKHLNILQRPRNVIDEKFFKEFGSDCSAQTKQTILSMKDPHKSLQRLHVLIGQMCSSLNSIVSEEKVEQSDETEKAFMENSRNLDTHVRSPSKDFSKKLYLGETYSLMLDRWEKLNDDFYSVKDGMYDLSKIPDVYDMIRYDILHNYHNQLSGTEELYERVRALENACVPHEYGKDVLEKSIVGSKVCGALLEKIKYDLRVSRSDTTQDMRFLLDHSHADDLEINSLGRVVRTRLYFTSESHMHTLLNVLKYAGTASSMLGMCTKAEGIDAVSEEGKSLLAECPELSYCTQIVIRLFEERGETTKDASKFRCELCFTPGANNDIFVDKSAEISPYIVLNKDISCEELLSCLTKGIMIGKEMTPEEAIAKMQAAIKQDNLDVNKEVHDAHLTDQPYTQGGEDSAAAAAEGRSRSGALSPATFGSRKFPVEDGQGEESEASMGGSSPTKSKGDAMDSAPNSPVGYNGEFRILRTADSPLSLSSLKPPRPPLNNDSMASLLLSSPISRVDSLASIEEHGDADNDFDQEVFTSSLTASIIGSSADEQIPGLDMYR